ncbi:MAG: hypothetical protein IIA67_09240 [Planctomycetes bacterium]|nr:hypothetical protein [Planctomycetota bacterium]
MDLEKQRRLEPLRVLVPVVAAVVVAYLFYRCIHADSAIKIAVYSISMAGVTVILAFGVASIKLRRTMFNQEQRIRNLEREVTHFRDEQSTGTSKTKGTRP